MATSSSAPGEPWNPANEDRVSTGVAALDTILHGGLVAHRPYLVVGASGTGKTTLALQFLCQGVREGERVLIVTLEEPPNEMKANHRALGVDLDEVYVFDAIPDIMRYERAPFKDIATVRHSVKFRDVPDEIRKSPELASVEVTLTALEQTIRTEISRFRYQRIVIDSLTALQYFCMKGFDETAGAQSFLRFLSDLRVTTLLTVEAPLEDVETPERLLARGEIRLFRWELDGRTVRAVGVEKFRGSPHDVRLHPYRIGPQGVDVNLATTISRDTMLEVAAEAPLRAPQPSIHPQPHLQLPSAMGPWTQDLLDLATVGADLRVVRELIQRASTAARVDQTTVASELLMQVRGEVAALVQEFSHQPLDIAPSTNPGRTDAARRLVLRATEARVGLPPSVGLDVESLPTALDALLTPSDTPLPAGQLPLEPSREPAARAPPGPHPAVAPSPLMPSGGPAVGESPKPTPVPTSVDISLAAARLPTVRADESSVPVVESPPPPGEVPASWESPALLPTTAPASATGSRSLGTPVTIRPTAEPPPLPRPKAEVEFLTVPPAPGSSSSTAVRLPVHVAPHQIAVAAAGPAGTVFELDSDHDIAIVAGRPPLPSAAAGEAPRPVLRPVVVVPMPATPSPRTRQSRPSRRSARAVSVSVGSVASDSTEAGEALAAGRRRRRTSGSSRKKSVGTVPAARPPTPVAVVSAAGTNPPRLPVTVSTPAVNRREAGMPIVPPAERSGEPSAVPPTAAATAVVLPDPALVQPKRRPARRRKAPPVTGAAPGSRPMADPSLVSSNASPVPGGAVVSDSSPPAAPAAAAPAPGPTTTDSSVERRE